MPRLMLILALLPAHLAAGEDAGDMAPHVTADARDAALAKAVRYLDEELWKLEDAGSPRRQYSLAVAGWAYLLAPDKGGRRLPSRRRQLHRIHKELVRYVERVAKLYDKDDRSRARAGAPVELGLARFKTAQYAWTLGMCAHFFAESAARGKRRAQCTAALRSIVRVLEASQQENGGWGHDDAARPGLGLPAIPIPKPGGGKLHYPATLIAASNCALSGLGVAHRALKTKRAMSLDRGRAYYEKAQNGAGTFPYDPSQRHALNLPPAMAGIEVARTPGAAFALFCAGAPADDPVATRALAAIDKSPELVSEGHGSATMGLQFAALLARARGTRAWRSFRRLYFHRILAAQQKDGAFLCACKHANLAVTCDTRPIPGMPAGVGWAAKNKPYVTAIHVLILCLDRTPARALPAAPAPRGPVSGG